MGSQEQVGLFLYEGFRREIETKTREAGCKMLHATERCGL